MLTVGTDATPVSTSSKTSCSASATGPTSTATDQAGLEADARSAALFLDAAYTWVGIRAVAGQPLGWPRVGTLDQDSRPIPGDHIPRGDHRRARHAHGPVQRRCPRRQRAVAETVVRSSGSPPMTPCRVRARIRRPPVPDGQRAGRPLVHRPRAGRLSPGDGAQRLARGRAARAPAAAAGRAHPRFLASPSYYEDEH